MKHLARWGACVALLLAGCTTPALAGTTSAPAVKPTLAPAVIPVTKEPSKVPAKPAAQPAIQVTPTKPGMPAATPAPVAPTKAWLVAKESVKDIGTVDRGNPAKYTFVVKNTGDKQLKILAKPG